MDIYIAHRDVTTYPSPEAAYSPSVRYPEYPFGEPGGVDNPVYDMVRDTLHGLGLDDAHFGRPDWNPLGDIIRRNDTVLLKPNLVSHQNGAEGKGGTLDSLVTHASVLRAVTDYCLIALRGTGRIILADAPVQSCDFGTLMERGHYRVLEQFYRAHDVEISFADLRSTCAVREKNGLLTQEVNKRCAFGARVVELGADSAFAGVGEERENRLRVTNYDPAVMRAHHHGQTQEYFISDALLMADVVIDLPKPKTHRKAGITGCMKNFVGINASKDYLPHHTMGYPERGGDEYPARSLSKRLNSALQEQIDIASAHHSVSGAKFWQGVLWCKRAAFRLAGVHSSAGVSEGNWAGNDTIWRMVTDINRIVTYADRDGVMRETPQRRVFCLCDLIVAGENNGPLSPTDRPMGMIVAGEDRLELDRLLASLFGVDPEKIPCVAKAEYGERYALVRSHCRIRSNDPALQADIAEEIDCGDYPHAAMPPGWESV